MEKKAATYPKLIKGVLCMAFILVYILFSFYYLSHSYSELLSDYISGPAFYRSDRFFHFFTIAQKNKGNIYCLISIPFAIIISYWFYAQKTGTAFLDLKKKYNTQKSLALWLLAVFILSLVFSFQGSQSNVFCTDEVFSAVNFAGEPAARILSYYPIPNNHVLFNLINHYISIISGDPFTTGRVLSSIFYSLLIAGNFLLIRHFSKNNLIAFCCAALLAQQFIVWGFGHQARGYSLCYLLGWGSALSFYGFYLGSKKYQSTAIVSLVLCNILGMWTIPVYLYMLVFQALAAFFLFMYRRRIEWHFVQAYIISIIGTFLVYLPLFCYSGLDAFSNAGFNGAITVYEIINRSADYFWNVVTLQTFNFSGTFKALGAFFFILPFMLYGLCKRRLGGMGPIVFLYANILLAVLTMIVISRQFPVMRGIGLQMQFSLLVNLLLIVSLIKDSIKSKRVLISAFAIMTILLSAKMFAFNQKFSSIDLYAQDTKALMNTLKTAELSVNSNATIWLSDESFMWQYILKDRTKISAHNINFNQQQVLITDEDDKYLPAHFLENYKLKLVIGENFIYEHK